MTANKNESTQPSSGSDATKKTYETFDYPPSAPNANSLPGADANTAGGRPPQYATLTDAFKTIRLEHFKEVHKKPCARESFLTAIGAGFGVGGARFVLGGTSTPAGKIFPESDWIRTCVLSMQLGRRYFHLHLFRHV